MTTAAMILAMSVTGLGHHSTYASAQVPSKVLPAPQAPAKYIPAPLSAPQAPIKAAPQY